MWRPAESHAACIACCFLVSLLQADVYAIDSTGMPKFGEDLNNVTVPVGREAKFVCNVEGLATYKVAWLRVDTQTILTIHSHVITKNHRIAVTHSDHRIWYLHIRDVREADRGWYMCQINTDPMKSQQGYLQVVVPPDILDYPTSTDMVVREGGNVSMQCAASGFPNPSITWRKEGGQSICLSPNTEVSAVNGPWLNVSKVNRLHMGAYLCIASNGIPPSVSKRIMLIIQFPPMIWIQNQLVGAQEGQSVTLECTSEAYPKSIEYWTKDKTTIISNGTKYYTDLKDNVYKTYMKLTIISVTLSDYGTYQCVSKNSLGDTDGTIKLYAVPKPTTTTTTTTTTAPTTTTSTTTTTKVATTVTGGWWTTEVPKKSSKFGGKAPANEVDRRPSKKTGKHQDAAEDAGDKKDDPTGGDQQQSSRAAAAAAAGDNNGRPALSKKHKNGSASVHPALGVTAAVWIIITQRIFPL
ncbi:lachesin-like isoform X1 [Rhopalosiphum padi]|uniref:lachesin-like isoform X1 n=2 Tax=Rhopalosiphum padi TaxID=40932 RepID=UPI00298E44A1|nr:lachesin-like isoform X1 [Rhopalosiphum padi]